MFQQRSCRLAVFSISAVVLSLMTVGASANVSIAASYTLTCTQTGGTSSPYSLVINNANDEVIKESAKDCGGALSIPAGVRKVDFGAFVPWTQQNTPLSNADITSISMPNTLETIHVGGFINLTSVPSVVVPSSVTTIGHQAFQGMTSLQTIRIEGSSTSTPTVIQYAALHSNSVDLSFGAGTIDLLWEFGMGSNIRSLDLGTGSMTIGENAFIGQQFSDLIIPPSVTSIGIRAFAQMPNLTEIDFGSATPGLTSISADAFTLTGITSVRYCGGNSVLDTYFAANLPNADVYCDPTLVPEIPSVSTVAALDGSVNINVAPGAANAGRTVSNYVVQYTTDGSNWTTYTRSPASASSLVSVPSLTNGTAYQFKVAAVNAAGVSGYSAASSTFTPVSSSPTTTTAPTTTTTPSSTTAIVPSAQVGQAVQSTPRRTTGTPSQTSESTTSTTSTSTTSTTVSPTTTAPEVVVNPPSISELEAGQASVLVDDKSESLSIRREDNRFIITSGDLIVAISGVTSDGQVTLLDDDGNVRLQQEDSIQVEASGFVPGSRVEVWMFSEPTMLDESLMSTSGTLTGLYPVPDGLNSGLHRVALVARTSDDKPVVFTLGMLLGESTGQSKVTLVVLALPILLAVVGALVLPATQRRRKLKSVS